MRYAGHWALLGYGNWAVRDKQSGEYLGSIGFFDGLRDITRRSTRRRWAGRW
ncbi:hypothetical protein M5585_22635 [Serratia ureilytica]